VTRNHRTRLPIVIESCLFDLDGVLVNSVPAHAAAWKEMFDAFLSQRADREGVPFVPFDARNDYERYVDGMRREDGVRTFLRSRGITLPEGDADDPPDAVTVHGLGNRKNELLHAVIEARGVEVYPGSVEFVRTVRADGASTAVVSSSTNARWILRSAGLDALFDVCIDGAYAAQRNLAGKPAPDTFLAAAKATHTDPASCAVFEDALAGVEAGHAGRFGLVVGVDRDDAADLLRAHGADVVVHDLAELLEEAP
jgi:beta-phosphoglucomutase family hydrolase